MTVQDADKPDRRSALRRAAPLIAVAAGAVALYVFGGDYLSFSALQEHHEALAEWRDAHFLLAAFGYVTLYAAVTALSFPGGLALTLAGGFLFGVVAGTALAVGGATTGAVIIFLIAKAGLGDSLRERAGPFMRRAEQEFHRSEVNYLLIIRLVPVMPFFVANILPAFLGASTWNYAWTTLVGIVPGGLVYASIGSGLGDVFAAGEQPDLGVIFAPHILLPLLGLAALASLPIAIRWWRR